ncbi:OadG family protein [Ruminococcaceae bacterium OttesenSCG-928-A16]|nr:OadG family protein [Ruminococcaceae bacterium OttesenSCG-928-A16]
MILEALQVMLFGMLGIFMVMGLIILSITLLKKIPSKKKDD